MLTEVRPRFPPSLAGCAVGEEELTSSGTMLLALKRRHQPETERRGKIIVGVQSGIDDRHVAQSSIYFRKNRESVPDFHIAFCSGARGGILHPVE